MDNDTLMKRSQYSCELCSSTEDLSIYPVPPKTDDNADDSIVVCNTCLSQINGNTSMDINHWRCLTESMWNDNQAVQVMAWRLLTRLNSESWAQDALEMLYLDEETLHWAQAVNETSQNTNHKDCNGTSLAMGDTVVLIKDLNIKGSSMIAKRGTAVRKINLVRDNDKYIEGRVNGQQIVILTQFVKKSI